MTRTLVAVLAGLTLAGCGGDAAPEAPTGQVAATVAGQEITGADVRLELASIANDPQAVARQQPAALDAIVNRKLLAAAAVERGMDKTPIGTMMLAKARELALISMLQQGIQGNVPKVSNEEATNYVQENSAAFAQRKLFAVDQLLVPQVSPALLKAMEPIDTLEQMIALLDRQKVPYRRGNAVVDPVTLDPAAARQIAQMKVGAVFVVPGNGGAQISRILETKAQPLVGEEAIKVANAVLYNRRVAGQVREQFEGIIKSGKPKVSINAAYQPKQGQPGQGGTRANGAAAAK